MYNEFFKEIVKRTLKIPTQSIHVIGDGKNMARQLDIALMSVGFKLSNEAFNYFSEFKPKKIEEFTPYILGAVQELVGDHVKHNVYFINFPNDVPNTITFWADCIIDALSKVESAEKILKQLQTGAVNLLDLPKYGKYQHSYYKDLIAAHEELIPLIKSNFKILYLGDTLKNEVINLYYSLAESKIPLNKEDLKLLEELANYCSLAKQPTKILIRENKAVINKVRLEHGYSPLIDTITDVLRVACLLSDGDGTLSENTKFKSFPRDIRRKLVKELSDVVKKNPDKLGDVNKYREQWKRLGERLHIYEYNQWPFAQDVLAVARRDKRVKSIAGKIENAFLTKDINESISLLSNFPGMLFRNIDRIIRAASPNEIDTLIDTIPTVIQKIPTRLILSVKEHLFNRLTKKDKRVFTNKKGTAWVTDGLRTEINKKTVEKISDIFTTEILKRMKSTENLIVDKNILNVAIPLSNKNNPGGFSVMSRGSITPITNENLRFFIYWKQKSETTDYDLSAIMLDRNFQFTDQLSYTRIKGRDGVHSGDITEAPNGASEFIDINLTKTNYYYIIPSINIYSGESFEEIDESFFGYMQRLPEQKGMPFEPTTVKTKFDIRGKGNVALPLVFIRDDNNVWTAKWLNIYLNGMPNMNRVEENKQSTNLLVRSMLVRDYLNMNYLITLMQQKAKSSSWYEGQELKDTDTFIGVNAPDKLSKNTTVFTLNNLQEILPV